MAYNDFTIDQLAARDGARACRYCGTVDDLCVDHILATSLGGANEICNMQILCRRCNSKKRDRPDLYRSGAHWLTPRIRDLFRVGNKYMFSYRPKTTWVIVDVSSDFCLVKFQSQDGKIHALHGRPLAQWNSWRIVANGTAT